MNFTEDLYNLLERIAATPGKNDKQALVATMTPTMLAIVRRALDPTTPTYIAKLAIPDNAGTKDFGIDEANLLDKLTSRELTGNAALSAVNEALANLTKAGQHLLQRVILKDLRAGIGASTVNKAFPGAVPEFAYMRCSLPKDVKFADWPWERGVISQLKADGMFARIAVAQDPDKLTSTVQITSRQGLTFPKGALAKLEADASWVFAPGTETHGELTVWHNGTLLHRKDGNGLLNSLQDGAELPEGHEVRFDAWDQIPLELAVPGGLCETPYEERFEGLKIQVLAGGTPSIMLIEHKIVRSYAEAAAHFREMLLRKLEGTVVKRPDMPWADGDSRGQIKFKLEFSVDLRIKGFNPGEPGKRTEKTFGSLLCETSDGLLQVGVSGFKRDIELYLHENREAAIGMVITVRANDIVAPSDSSEFYALSHPRFIEIRKDKTVADTLQRVLDQHAAAVQGKAMNA
jgi:DNA ligase-1